MFEKKKENDVSKILFVVLKQQKKKEEKFIKQITDDVYTVIFRITFSKSSIADVVLVDAKSGRKSK